MPIVRVSKSTMSLLWECKGLSEIQSKECIPFDTVIYEAASKYYYYLKVGERS